ncbi:hypothetical protein HPB50_012416 [Hyalomma asiaticum]|uniref:Uncharacterized protein n=1 Tax=Hyalomma asiaticum TaxID=266040 RepID=A0ACB7SXI9_HYAAI|nr:hypothetical protein HPB50_012416 [Hyalomma asiaticum]
MIVLSVCRRVLRGVVRLAFPGDPSRRPPIIDKGTWSARFLRRRTTVMMAALIAYTATFAIVAPYVFNRRHGLAIHFPVFNFTSTNANVFNNSSLDEDVPVGCDEDEISSTVHLMASSLNTSADPCKDFHTYVCGGFKRSVRTSLLNEVEKNVTASISRFFLRLTRGVRKSLPAALSKAVTFYGSCVKPIHVDGKTHALASFFKEQDFSFNTKINGFLETTLELQLRLGLQIFFTLMVDPYPRSQETFRYLYLGSSQLFEEWKRVRRYLFRSGSYTRFASAVVLATGYDRNATPDLVRKVWYVESKLMTRAIKPKREPNARKLEAKWRELLRLYSGGTFMGPYKLSLRSRSSRFFHQMMFKANGAEQSVYITWEVARHLASASGFVEVGSMADRRTYCFDMTYAIYGPAISAPILFQFVNNSRIDQVRRMVRTLAGEVYASIEDSDWLLPETKAKLIEKLRLVKWKVGYDRNLGSWPGLNDYYQGYPVASGIFLSDYVNTHEAHIQKFLELTHWRREVDFNFRSDVVGAFYEGPNVLVIPAASMLSPLFNYGASPSINYGLLGSVVMQNLMRAFGHNNMLTDASGKPMLWLREERADFEDRYHCDRMSEVRDSDDDPLADVSVGAQAFFRAYRRASAARGNRSCVLSGPAKHSSDQVFFVSRCLLRCHDVPGTIDGVRLEDHTCNLMAKHSAEFANAFNCPMDHSNFFVLGQFIGSLSSEEEEWTQLVRQIQAAAIQIQLVIPLLLKQRIFIQEASFEFQAPAIPLLVARITKAVQETTEARRPLATEDWATANAELRERGLLPSGSSKEGAAGSGASTPPSVLEQLERARLIDDINAPSFSQQSFVSRRDHVKKDSAASSSKVVDNHAAAIFGSFESLISAAKEVVPLSNWREKPELLIHPKLKEPTEVKLERWRKKLAAERRKRVNGTTTSGLVHDT